ncbi:uncharacterized protein [Bombus flavifrons]|uniref:uncharacterized protein n=1 Tax=Bombus flavifrons TaxID=103934 RepID=UPI003703D3BF
MWNVILLSKVVVLGRNLGRLKHVGKLLTAYRCEFVEHDKRENCKCPNTFTRRYTRSVVMSYNNGFYSASVTSGFVFTLLTLRRNAIPSDVAGFGPRHSRSEAEK